MKDNNTFVDEKIEPVFAAYVRRVLGPALARFGLERRDGEAEVVSILRPQLLYWLGRHGRDPAIMAFATELVRAYMADSGSVDPSLVARAPLLSNVIGVSIPDTELTSSFDAKLRKSSLADLLATYLVHRARTEPIVITHRYSEHPHPTRIRGDGKSG